MSKSKVAGPVVVKVDGRVYLLTKDGVTRVPSAPPNMPGNYTTRTPGGPVFVPGVTRRRKR